MSEDWKMVEKEPLTNQPQSTILNKEELEKWEASRDLLKEISDGVDKMMSEVNVSNPLDKPI